MAWGCIALEKGIMLHYANGYGDSHHKKKPHGERCWVARYGEEDPGG